MKKPFFRLRASPVSEWPRLPDAAVNPIWALYREIDRTQWLAPEILEEEQLSQLRLVLGFCAENVPYYQRLFARHDIIPDRIRTLSDLRRVPALTRELYQANFADICARKLPTGTTKTGNCFTSGTTGVPIEVLQTSDVNRWWLACLLRDLEWAGLDPRGKLASIRLIAKSPEEFERMKGGFTQRSWHKFFDAFLETGTVCNMDIHEEPRSQLEWLQSEGPDYLLSLPSNLDFLAKLIREQGIGFPDLRMIQAIGESLSDEVRQNIEEGFGVPVKNLYSTSETGYIASDCPDGHGMHVHAENVLVEVLDENDQPCQPGKPGRVLVTTLRNFLAPFVRYEILDEAVPASDLCPCGRGLPLLARVKGRQHPLMHLPDGKRKIITGLYLGLRQIGGCHQFQIIQRAVEHVVIRLVPDKTWTGDHEERIRELVHKHFEMPIRVDVEKKDRLELPRSGKLKIGVIEIDE